MFFPPQDRMCQVEVSTLCNLKCEGCIRTVSNEAAMPWESKHLSLDEFKRIVECARPTETISLQGIGEPTLNPDLPEMVSFAKASGKFRNIMFYSNALARDLDYYADLHARGHNQLIVSVDSLTQEIADKCRYGTRVDKLFERLDGLYKIYKNQMQVSLVLSRKNIDDCFETMSKVDAIGSITFFIQKMIPTSAEIDEKYVLNAQETADFRNKLDIIRARFKNLNLMPYGDLSSALVKRTEQHTPVKQTRPVGCIKPFVDRYITIDGYLTPCCVIIQPEEWAHARLEGSLEKTFQENQVIQNWYRAFETTGNKACNTCCFNEALNKNST